jgi:membrane protease subunit HflK
VPWNKPGGSGDQNPWGQGGRDNQGPPDLDEIVRKIQAKLGGLFGGGRGRGGGGVSRGAGGFGIGVIIAVLVAVWLASGVYVVQQGSQGVVLRFGKAVEVANAGLHWHLPYPIEHVEKVNVEQRSIIEIGYRSNPNTGGKTKRPHEALMLTEDENIVDIEFAVQYRISDAEKYLFNVRNVEGTIQAATESAVREEAGKNTMDFILTSGRDVVGDNTKKILQEILNRYDCGILITNLEMQEAQPPEQVKAAFDDAVKAREDEARLKNEAEAYSNDILPRARGAAARTVQEAEGYKASVVAHAEGDARRFSQIAREYAKAPRVTRDRMYLETMEQVMEKSTKVLIDQKGGNNLIYLPLDQILARAANKVGKSAESDNSSSEPKPQPSIRERMQGRVPAGRTNQ